MAEVGTAAGAVVAGAGALSALESEPAYSSLPLRVLLTTAATGTTIRIPTVTGLLTAMALMAIGTVVPTMAMAATTRAIATRVITPIVVTTIGTVATTHIAGTPIAENRAALDHQGRTAARAVFPFSPARYRGLDWNAAIPFGVIRL
jgi:hypothetical protein